eukprot:PLAT8496.1.p2 GENE.PLAT8496.1~~PLAT8496.1.p2  ORF type:complete len:246 (+),score=123.83 PLAT8496.1:89-739(+)
MEAVRRGAAAVGVRGADVVVLAVERRAMPKLQILRTARKICSLDEHVALAFAGLHPDARVLVNRARLECQNYRLAVEDAVPVEYLARQVAKLQQRYTQRGGVRPFGLSTLIAGHDPADGRPQLYETNPSGTFTAWKAKAIGRNDDSVLQFLEKNYEEEASEADTLKLAVRALMEVVEAGGKSIELAVMRAGEPLSMLSEDDVEAIVTEIKEEDEAA